MLLLFVNDLFLMLLAFKETSVSFYFHPAIDWTNNSSHDRSIIVEHIIVFIKPPLLFLYRILSLTIFPNQTLMNLLELSTARYF